MSEAEVKSMEDRFAILEKRIISIMTFGITSIGVFVALIGVFVLINMSNQSKTEASLTETRRDIGTILLVAPNDHRESPFFNDLIIKYNPNRGTVQ